MSEGHTPAFPVPTATWQSHGMTKREAFAMAALQGILANRQYDPPRRRKLAGMATDAVAAADHLIEALKEMP